MQASSGCSFCNKLCFCATFSLLGEILAKAYFMGSDPLVDIRGEMAQGNSLEGKFFFRSTNKERTKMSGSQLMSSLIG